MDLSSWLSSDSVLAIAFFAFVFYLVLKLWASPAPARMADLTPKPPPVVPQPSLCLVFLSVLSCLF